MMKFLLDVCAGGRLTNWLRDQGFDVKEVRGKDICMPDESIIDWAVMEKRIIITLDKDFGELFVLQGKTCSIIRLPDVSAEQRLKLMDLTLQKYSQKLENNTVIITISEKRIRIRTLDDLKK